MLSVSVCAALSLQIVLALCRLPLSLSKGCSDYELCTKSTLFSLVHFLLIRTSKIYNLTLLVFGACFALDQSTRSFCDWIKTLVRVLLI